MAFQLYKSPGSSTVQTETFIASAAIAIGDPVKLAAGDSGVGKGKVTKLVGGTGGSTGASELVYGVAVSAASGAGEEIQVIPVDSRQTWVADSAANTNSNNIGERTTYIGTDLLVAVDGTITTTGNKVVIVGVLGATGDKKYLVKFTMSTTLFGGAAFTS